MEYFESIKCEDYDILNLSFHEKRIMKSISKNFSLNEYINPPSNELLKCKLVYNEDEIISIEYTPYIKKKIEVFKFVYENDIIYNKKRLKRDDINNLFEKKELADEIIIVKNSLLTDTSIANIAIFDGSIWLTPKKPLLEGTMRASLLEKQEIFEKDISVEMFKNAKKVALMNAMIGFDVLKSYSCFE